MGRAIDKACRGSEVTLRALWCKARSGGGRLRQATEREDKRRETRREEAREEDKRREDLST